MDQSPELVTNTSDKYYPIDAQGINAFGIEHWLETYQMPVTGRDYKSIYEYVSQAYLHHLCHTDIDEEIYWLAVANLKIARLITNYLFYMLRLEKLKQANYTHILSHQPYTLAQAKEQILTDDLTRKFDFSALPTPTRQTTQLKTAYNSLSMYASSLFSGPKKVFALTTTSSETQNYAKEQNYIPIRYYLKAFAPQQVTAKPIQQIHDRTELFVRKALQPYPFISASQSERLIIEVSRILSAAYYFLAKNKQTISRYIKSPLLADGLGAPVNRLLIAAWRLSGNTTIGFPHGNTYATCYDPIHIDSDGLSIVNTLHASSRGQANLLNALATDHNRGLRMATPSHPETSHYKVLFDRLQSQTTKSPSPQKSIMIIGFPLNEIIYPSFPSNHAFSNLHLDIRIATQLRKAGYKLIYKTHPDKTENATNILGPYFDEVISDRFESIYDQADCLLFTYSRTSTFGFAMLTPKPIVLVNLDDVFWHPDVSEPAQKRCHFVSAHADEHDRIQYSENELLSSIQEALESSKQDYTIVNEYAL